MANTPGMFTGLNKYEAELIDAAKQREASSADVGTGWQAMTQASGRAGGMIGRTVGKALGGVTTAEQRLQDFQAITSTRTFRKYRRCWTNTGITGSTGTTESWFTGWFLWCRTANYGLNEAKGSNGQTTSLRYWCPSYAVR